MDNISPEEKLLKLIRGKKKNKTGDKQNVEKPINGKAPFKSSLASIRVNSFSLNSRRVIWSLLIVSCAYTLFVFIYPLDKLQKKVDDIQTKPEEFIIPEAGFQSKSKPYSFYLEKVRNGQIFKPPVTQTPKDSIKTADSDLIKYLNLVGVISDGQAVIENKKTQKTHYLRKGQFIDEFQVEDVQKRKVILKYNNQEFELHL